MQVKKHQLSPMMPIMMPMSLSKDTSKKEINPVPRCQGPSIKGNEQSITCMSTVQYQFSWILPFQVKEILFLPCPLLQ